MDSKIKSLVEKAKAGDADAFGVLYQLFHPKMKGVCVKILKGDKGVVDDLVQDAFILALISIKNLRNEKSFGQWLTSITTNLALKYQEKGNKVQIVPIDILEDETNSHLVQGVAPEPAWSYESIMAAIEQLPKGYKDVFKMYVLDGLSHQEIAKILNIAPHSSSSQLARARGMLRNILNAKTLALLVLALISLPIYKYFLHREQREIPQERKGLRKTAGEVPQYASGQKQGTRIVAGKTYDTAAQETIQVSFSASADSVKGNIAENKKDSLPDADSIIEPENQWRGFITERYDAREGDKWHVRTVASLGTTLAQRVDKVMTGKESLATSDQTSAFKDFTTWEDYAQFLHSISSADPTPENTVMQEIADHNQGNISEAEHHDKPITFGLVVNKRIGGGLSLETGLQYSFLKSSFRLGTGTYYVNKEQRLHYLGIPLRLSYPFAKYGDLSAYATAGMVLQIPVSGKTTADYVTDGTVAYTNNRKLAPPMQWTLNTSLGIQYQFAPNFNLFVEPTLDWYVPNGSKIRSVWTERPVTFTVPFGIRYTW